MNVYEIITQQIIDNLNKATSWSDMVNFRMGPINLEGRPYRGINMMLLGNSGHQSRIWGTYNQIIKHGGQVRKGQKSSIVCFWKVITPEKTTSQQSDPKSRWFLRYYRVFNIDQCHFVEDNEYLAKLAGTPKDVEDVPEKPQSVIDNYISREGINLQFSETVPNPYYSPGRDLIKMIPNNCYKNNDEYLLTLFHEMVHSTGHKKRLDRFTGANERFGSKDYSFEELVAEIGATFISTHLELKPDFLNSVAYMRGWCHKLSLNPKWIVSAASKAEKAAELILQIVHEPKTVIQNSPVL